MEQTIVNRFMRLLSPLSLEVKLEILSKLSTQVKIDFKSKEKSKQDLLNEITGGWKDTEDSLVEDILKARTTNKKFLEIKH